MTAKGVLLFSGALHGGGGKRVMLNLSRGLRDRGYRVIFGTVTYAGPVKSKIPYGVEHWSVSSSHFQDRYPKFLLGAIALIKLPIILRRGRIIAVISDGPLPAFLFSVLWAIGRYRLPWFGRKGTGIAAWKHSQRKSIAQLACWLHRVAYSRSTAIIVPVQAVKNDLVRELPVKRSLVHILPNPVDYHAIISAARRETHTPCEHTRPYIVAVNRLIARKRTHLAIDVLASLHPTYPELSLVIVGEGPEEQVLRDQVERLGLKSCVSFCGFVDNPMPILEGALALLMTSFDEGFGFAVVEAMALGCIPIAYHDNPGPASIIDHNQTGFLVTPDGSVSAIVAALVSLIGSPTRRAEMQQAARTAAAAFDIEHASAAYANLIEAHIGGVR